MQIVASIVLVCFLSASVHAAGAQDTTAPRVLHEVVQTGVIGQSLELRVRLQDQSDIFEPKVYFRRVGELEYNTIDLVKGPKDEWVGVVPGTFVVRNIEYFLEAYDIMGNGPSRHGGPDRPHLVKISTRVDPNQQNGQPRQLHDAVRPAHTSEPAPAVATQAASGGVTKQWWFWTLIGLGIAGAVAAGTWGIIAATKASQGPQSFNEVTVNITGTDPREGL